MYCKQIPPLCGVKTQLLESLSLYIREMKCLLQNVDGGGSDSETKTVQLQESTTNPFTRCMSMSIGNYVQLK